MRILLLSYNAPYATDRAGKIARFLLLKGYDVRVICAHEDDSLHLAEPVLPADRITRTLPPDIYEQTIMGRISRLYGSKRATDTDREWYKAAILTASELLNEWMPDVIYGVCPPHVIAPVAARVSTTHNIPFALDLQACTPTGNRQSGIERRNPKDVQKEKDLLKRANAIVLTSQVWAQDYARRYGAGKVHTIMDGFDPESYPPLSPVPLNDDRKTLHLFYIPEKHPRGEQISVLLDGIRALADGAQDIHLTIAGDETEAALKAAQAAGLNKQISIIPADNPEELVKRRYGADALVITLCNDESDAGYIPEDVFNAIGTRRPVIAMGYSKGITAGIIRERNLGIFSNEPKVIATRLAKLLATKRAIGVVPQLPEAIRKNAAVDTQLVALEPILHGLVAAPGAKVAAE